MPLQSAIWDLSSSWRPGPGQGCASSPVCPSAGLLLGSLDLPPTLDLLWCHLGPFAASSTRLFWHPTAVAFPHPPPPQFSHHRTDVLAGLSAPRWRSLRLDVLVSRTRVPRPIRPLELGQLRPALTDAVGARLWPLATVATPAQGAVYASLIVTAEGGQWLTRSTDRITRAASDDDLLDRLVDLLEGRATRRGRRRGHTNRNWRRMADEAEVLHAAGGLTYGQIAARWDLAERTLDRYLYDRRREKSSALSLPALHIGGP
jgi:hypothetical protein